MSFHVIHLQNAPIYEQLLLEETLLHSDTRNWCMISQGSPPSIVLGISGKKHELVDCAAAKKRGIPLVKRFSGGGTVVVDEATLFITFICQKSFHTFPAFPEPILRWGEEMYKDLLPHPEFALRENDFVIGHKKCGGNAQYIKKERWLLHTSFLWDYSSAHMDLLLMPKKTPVYRAGRKHSDFLCRLKDFFPSKEELIQNFLRTLSTQYELVYHSFEEVRSFLTPGSRIATELLTTP